MYCCIIFPLIFCRSLCLWQIVVRAWRSSDFISKTICSSTVAGTVAALMVHAVLVTETHNFTPPTVYIFDGCQTYVVNYINPFPLHFETARTISAPIVLSVLGFTMSGHAVSVLLLCLGHHFDCLQPPALNSYLTQIMFFQIFSCSAESKNRTAAKQNSPLMFT